MDNNKGPQLCFVAPLELLLHKLHFFLELEVMELDMFG
jgi:hypothetical protein